MTGAVIADAVNAYLTLCAWAGQQFSLGVHRDHSKRSVLRGAAGCTECGQRMWTVTDSSALDEIAYHERTEDWRAWTWWGTAI